MCFLLLMRITLLWWSVWADMEGNFLNMYLEMNKEGFLQNFSEKHKKKEKRKWAVPAEVMETLAIINYSCIKSHVMFGKQKLTCWDSLEIFPSPAVTIDNPVTLVVHSRLRSSGRGGPDPVSRNSSQGWEQNQNQVFSRWEFETYSKPHIRVSCLWLPGFYLNTTGPSLAKAHTQALCHSV